MKFNLSIVYSVIIAAIVGMTLIVCTGFMEIGEGDQLEVMMQVLVSALIIVYVFFLAILSAVSLGFASLFFKLDEFEHYMLRGLDVVEARIKSD
ncbi:MAG: hypothetical protein QF415_07075 [Candidatus Undinarchaeales archaeon]|jgi:hypothetical protein|nr:hypothetical protein [Candidatus Undinarchaeales archaeon]MDP7494039.1 hypothetical protein [Candidatus Undinarchaeales archaeon]